jgi:LPS-assembly lipoprotein
MSWSDRRHALAALAAAAVAGCGFELRQAPVLNFRSIALTGFAPRSPLAEELRRSLVAGNVQVLDAPAQAEVVLQALSDRRDKIVVGTTSAAEVREFQLQLRLRFRVRTPAGRELIAPVELLLTRDLSYSESTALAKALEEADLFREMQSDVVAQVLRRLAAISLS